MQINIKFYFSLDEKLIMEVASNHEVLITIEEGSIGGFGSHVKNLLAEKGIFDKGFKFRSMNLPDKFIDQDDPKKMYDKAGLNAWPNVLIQDWGGEIAFLSDLLKDDDDEVRYPGVEI